MSQARRPRDLDMDPAGPGRLPRAAGPEEWYSRLVANPFLSLSVWLFTIVCVRALHRQQVGDSFSAMIDFGVGVVLVVLGYWLLHYHCLDCGSTGHLTRWRSHLCPAVAARRIEGRPRRWRGLTPGIQALAELCMFGLLVAMVVASLRAAG